MSRPPPRAPGGPRHVQPRARADWAPTNHRPGGCSTGREADGSYLVVRGKREMREWTSGRRARRGAKERRESGHHGGGRARPGGVVYCGSPPDALHRRLRGKSKAGWNVGKTTLKPLKSTRNRLPGGAVVGKAEARRSLQVSYIDVHTCDVHAEHRMSLVHAARQGYHRDDPS